MKTRLSKTLVGLIIVGGIFFVSCDISRKKGENSDKENSNQVINSDTYLSIRDPDTALVVFLYRNYKNFDYENQIEEYGRWRLEKAKLLPLFKNLFEREANYEDVVSLIELNLVKYIDSSRLKVESDYVNYHEISNSKEYDYLTEAKDTFLCKLYFKMIADSKVSKNEKEKLRRHINYCQ
ncbi:MAG: hypothetical protein JNM88_20505 [Chitinophagaceae bacterium]|nr:hypothetical protein [Chitinophagaceae bacterium]